MPKCVRAPPDPDFFILGYMHGLSVNGQSSCEGEKSELVRGLLEGRGSREETRQVKALSKGQQRMAFGVFNACLGTSDLFYSQLATACTSICT